MFLLIGRTMKRALLLMTVLSACTSSDDAPTVTVAISDDAKSVSIALERSPDHTFGTLVATVNGVDAGAPAITPGEGPPSDSSPFNDQSSDSFARFLVPLASLQGSDVHVELAENGDHFTIDVPELLAPRAIRVVTPANTQFHANDQIAVTSGVATDTLVGGFEAQEGDADCFSNVRSTASPGSVAFTMPPDLAQDWFCGAAPAPGTTLPATLDFEISVETPVATCTGPELTCGPSSIPMLTAKVPVTLAF
jgi:hypothetical protein